MFFLVDRDLQNTREEAAGFRRRGEDDSQSPENDDENDDGNEIEKFERWFLSLNAVYNVSKRACRKIYNYLLKGGAESIIKIKKKLPKCADTIWSRATKKIPPVFMDIKFQMLATPPGSKMPQPICTRTIEKVKAFPKKRFCDPSKARVLLVTTYSTLESLIEFVRSLKPHQDSSHTWNNLDFSVDGIPAGKSTHKSFDIVAATFRDCGIVSPWRIYFKTGREVKLDCFDLLSVPVKEINKLNVDVDSGIADSKMRRTLKNWVQTNG